MNSPVRLAPRVCAAEALGQCRNPSWIAGDRRRTNLLSVKQAALMTALKLPGMVAGCGRPAAAIGIRWMKK